MCKIMIVRKLSKILTIDFALLRKTSGYVIDTSNFCRDLSYNDLSGTLPSWINESNIQLYVCVCICIYTAFLAAPQLPSYI